MKEGFWDDMENSQKVLKLTKDLKTKVEKYENLKSSYDDTLDMIEMAIEEEEDEMYPELNEAYKAIKEDLEKQTLETLLSGPYDKNNAIVTLHAGAGGTESHDWAEMLYRMYTHYAEKAGYSVSGGVNAPYIWLKTPDNMTSWEFFDYLLENANVVGTPGSGFGPSGEGYFRLTAFGSYENTVAAIERIQKL